jgi:hypothetical protein
MASGKKTAAKIAIMAMKAKINNNGENNEIRHQRGEVEAKMAANNESMAK